MKTFEMEELLGGIRRKIWHFLILAIIVTLVWIFSCCWQLFTHGHLMKVVFMACLLGAIANIVLCTRTILAIQRAPRVNKTPEVPLVPGAYQVVISAWTRIGSEGATAWLCIQVIASALGLVGMFLC